MPETSCWVFGYGSLLWRPGFEWIEKVPASLEGWARRFWQGSPDHRGTRRWPGRVVTLIRRHNARCRGYAFRLPDAARASILAQLDVREQGGYQQHTLPISLADGRSANAVTWIAGPGNPDFLGPATYPELARHIASCRGLSGTNVEYFLHLFERLQNLGTSELHVRRIACWLKQM